MDVGPSAGVGGRGRVGQDDGCSGAACRPGNRSDLAGQFALIDLACARPLAGITVDGLSTTQRQDLCPRNQNQPIRDPPPSTTHTTPPVITIVP